MTKVIPKRLSSKIRFVVFIAIFISFLVSGIFIYFVSEKIVKQRIISDLRLQAKIIGSNTSAAILFDDKNTAFEILKSLKTINEIESVVLYDRAGKEFAYYIKEGSIFIPHYSEQLDSDDHIVVVEKIYVDKEIIGKIVFSANTNRLKSLMRFILGGVIVSIFISLLIAMVLTFLFTRRIFFPAKILVDSMKTVTEKKDYSIRVDILSEDEFGSIARGFNEMLVQIQLRDKELNRYREHLEDEVKSRTKELADLNIKLEEELKEVRHMEEIISKSATEWRTTFDSIKDAVFLLDENGNIKRCNSTASEILKRSFSEIVGKNICVVVHSGYNVDCGINDAIREKIRISKTIHLGERVYQIYYDPILFDEKILGFVHIMSDITEQYNLDENIKQVQKMEAIGRLAGGVAHDFNNLLSIMTLYTGSLMKRLKDDQRSINELNEIKKVIDRATSLAKQLLTFSRKQILNPEVFDVNESLRINKKMLSRLIGENIEIILNLCEKDATILADRSQFDNVIINMVINSRDAMPKGGKIVITTEVRVINKDEILGFNPQNKEYLILKISDNGEGMSEETQKKIFEPFFTTKPKGKGTGLGLSMVYGFVNQCNGHIEVKSKVGEGTTFTLYFPISSEQKETIRPQSSLIRALTGKNIHILLVEDDDDVRKSIVKMLEDNNINVTEASRPGNALDLLMGGRKFDLILSDIVMPGMNGIDFYNYVKQNNIDVPFLLMTGYSDDFLPQEDVSRYKDIILQKPFNERQLLSKIRELLSNGR